MAQSANLLNETRLFHTHMFLFTLQYRAFYLWFLLSFQPTWHFYVISSNPLKTRSTLAKRKRNILDFWIFMCCFHRAVLFDWLFHHQAFINLESKQSAKQYTKQQQKANCSLNRMFLVIRIYYMISIENLWYDFNSIQQ